MSTHQKSKGPASAATDPDRGSHPSSEDKEMNGKTDTTAGPAPATPPKMIDILDQLNTVQLLLEATFMACADLRCGDRRDGAIRHLVMITEERVDDIVSSLEALR